MVCDLFFCFGLDINDDLFTAASGAFQHPLKSFSFVKDGINAGDQTKAPDKEGSDLPHAVGILHKLRRIEREKETDDGKQGEDQTHDDFGLIEFHKLTSD